MIFIDSQNNFGR